jgi:ribosomal protein S18 acetylase RimI-like enzyme
VKDARRAVSVLPDVVRRDGSGLRVSPWPNDDLVVPTAQLAPVAGESLPSPSALADLTRELFDRGYSEAVTVALAPREQAPFLAAGFSVREELHLLVHRLSPLPRRAVPLGGPLTGPRAGPRTRRARNEDWPGSLATDSEAFTDFWRLGRHGLLQAMAATPVRRLRVMSGPVSDSASADDVIGYALTGRAGAAGYLQRLAVRPDAQGQGVGRALVLDGLHWLRRHRVERVLVNTQLANARALDLYLGVGFTVETDRLAVLRFPLTEGGER